MLCSVEKHAGSGLSTKELSGKHETLACVSPYFVSLMLLNRTELSQGFFVCFMIENPLTSLRITSLFFNQSECVIYLNCIL